MEGLVEKAIEALTPVIPEENGVRKPKLDAKLMKRPPFRYLYDIIMAVSRSTGFPPKKIFTRADLIENIKDKTAKINYLKKIIKYTGQVLGKKEMDLDPRAVISGKEVEKTLTFLITFVDAARRYQKHLERKQGRAAEGGKEGAKKEAPRERERERDSNADKEKEREREREREAEKAKEAEQEKARLEREAEKEREREEEERAAEERERKEREAREERERAEKEAEETTESPAEERRRRLAADIEARLSAGSKPQEGEGDSEGSQEEDLDLEVRGREDSLRPVDRKVSRSRGSRAPLAAPTDRSSRAGSGRTSHKEREAPVVVRPKIARPMSARPPPPSIARPSSRRIPSQAAAAAGRGGDEPELGMGMGLSDDEEEQDELADLIAEGLVDDELDQMAQLGEKETEGGALVRDLQGSTDVATPGASATHRFARVTEGVRDASRSVLPFSRAVAQVPDYVGAMHSEIMEWRNRREELEVQIGRQRAGHGTDAHQAACAASVRSLETLRQNIRHAMRPL
ncbi:TRAF3-interacting protein 1 [Kipferlia bialata]|uniref:TRAF3-interacting protein 1 n=1 Tax=Kipferlia bialata TaxID=797122 RepID=A0A9K3D0L5_9EUKA|nr:TRAF3-interacting protein 1 [Kipferlia bialata]|eukprot:g7678.t1